jgi:hypothetical protein
MMIAQWKERKRKTGCLKHSQLLRAKKPRKRFRPREYRAQLQIEVV